MDLWNEKLTRENFEAFYNSTVEMVYSSTYGICKETTRTENAIIKSYIETYQQRNTIRAEDVIFVFGDILLKNSEEMVERYPLPEGLSFAPRTLDEYTRNSMLEKITTNLWLNKPSMLIRIEDVSTEEERRHARSTRMNEGMHTIPVPTMEIKHEFSGYFSDPLGKIRSRLNLEEGGVDLNGENERTMIRPTFSSLGSYSISDEALLELIEITLKDLPGYGKVLEFKSEKRTIGVVFTLDLALLYGYDAQKVLYDAQQKIGNAVEKLTAITVVSVDIRAGRLVHGKENS